MVKCLSKNKGKITKPKSEPRLEMVYSLNGSLFSSKKYQFYNSGAVAAKNIYGTPTQIVKKKMIDQTGLLGCINQSIGK